MTHSISQVKHNRLNKKQPLSLQMMIPSECGRSVWDCDIHLGGDLRGGG